MGIWKSDFQDCGCVQVRGLSLACSCLYKKVKLPLPRVTITSYSFLDITVRYLHAKMFGRTNNNSTRTSAGAAPGVGPTRSTRSHELIQHILRALQLLSAVISLILFSVRLAKIVRLVGKASRSNGAVEGIVAAAVLYTLIVMALSLGLRASGSNLLRILFIVFDILFAGAFIAVAVLTSPKRHGSSGPCSSNADVNGFVNRHAPGDVNCNLPWGTFILAIVST